MSGQSGLSGSSGVGPSPGLPGGVNPCQPGCVIPLPGSVVLYVSLILSVTSAVEMIAGMLR